MNAPTTSVTSLGELVALVPYELGFRPSDSFVLVGIRAKDGRVVGACRFDHFLAEDPESGAVDDAARAGCAPDVQASAAAGETRRTLRRVARALRAGGAERVVVLSYEERSEARRADFVLLRRALDERGVSVLFEVVIRDGYGWVRPDPDGAPGHGFRVPDASRVRAVAHYVARGIAPLPHRQAVGALVAEDLVAAAPVAAVLAAVGGTGALGGAPPRAVPAWRRVAAARSPWVPSASEIAALARSLLDHDWRDGLIAALCPGWLPMADLQPGTRQALRRAFPTTLRRATSHELVDRLTQLCRHMPATADVVTAEVLAFTASVAWHHGEGVLAAEACERALRTYPGHRLAGLLDRALQAGLPSPRGSWPQPVRPGIARRNGETGASA